MESHHKAKAISEEMTEKGAIQEVMDDEEGFYYRLFLVPKKDDQMWPMINLRPLNQFLVHNHFQNGGYACGEGSKNDWMTIDLKDDYFSIPIHQRFKWERNRFS